MEWHVDADADPPELDQPPVSLPLRVQPVPQVQGILRLLIGKPIQQLCLHMTACIKGMLLESTLECWDRDTYRYASARLTLLYYCITVPNEDGCQDQMYWQEKAYGHDCCDLVLCYGVPAPSMAAMCP